MSTSQLIPVYPTDGQKSILTITAIAMPLADPSVIALLRRLWHTHLSIQAISPEVDQIHAQFNVPITEAIYTSTIKENPKNLTGKRVIVTTAGFSFKFFEQRPNSAYKHYRTHVTYQPPWLKQEFSDAIKVKK